MVDITKIAAIYADAERYGGMTVTVGGWAKTIRDLKTFGFIELNDGSCFRPERRRGAHRHRRGRAHA